MIDKVPDNILLKLYAINDFDCSNNDDFLLAMTLLIVEQHKDEKLQETLTKPTYKKIIGTISFENIQGHMIDKKIQCL